jgi:hypothetical protein
MKVGGKLTTFRDVKDTFSRSARINSFTLFVSISQDSGEKFKESERREQVLEERGQARKSAQRRAI